MIKQEVAINVRDREKQSTFYSDFFFQAEDGIRDLTVTGVQTCALPIYHHDEADPRPRKHATDQVADRHATKDETHQPQIQRSEERRVGKECRSRWSQDH